MNVQEAIKDIKENVQPSVGGKSLAMAIQSLEMQDKLKQWIENYKNPEFKDVVVTMDGLIDILEEFRLECETDARNTV